MVIFDAASGAFGVIIFEGLRIYKSVTAGRHPVPGNRFRWYGISILILTSGGALLSSFWAADNLPLGIYVGFSLPTGLSVLFQKYQKLDTDDDMWEDDRRVGKKMKFGYRIFRWLRKYFSFIN